MKKNYIIFFSLLLFMLITNVNAAVGSTSVSGATIEVGATTNLNVAINGNIAGFGGVVSIQDTSCAKINSVSAANGARVNGNNIAFADSAAPRSGFVIARVSVTGLKACSTKIVVSNILMSNDDAEESLGSVSNTITVKEAQKQEPTPSQPVNNTPSNNQNQQPSNNTNNNTNNNTQKNNDTNKNKENLSKENNLESLSIDNYEIAFNKNTLSYSIDVNYDVESINVKAKAVDNKANVSIVGNNNLKYGENNVKVIVTAENGDKKTYTIIVNRPPDPNKQLSSNSDLTSIKPSTGILSPVFNKDTLNYVIYLPYEVEKITFEVTAADTTASIEKEEVETLSIGNNAFKYHVRAENGNIKTYTITVKRANLYSSNNTKLKALELTNGKLNTNFDSNKFVYYYSKGNDFSFNAIPEDENATVKTYESDGIITIVVEAPNGEYSVYYLLTNKYKNSLFLNILFILIGFALGFITRHYLNNNKKKRKK